ILVLDEALSAVDAENEAAIQAALDRLMVGRTTLILAHRLSSIIDCDRILVLDGGRIVESGRHAALMQAGGVYARLMAEQARESSASTFIDGSPAGTAEAAAGLPAGAATTPVTEGIIKAEGLTWWQLIRALMTVIMPWKGRLAATFVFGVLRVVAFIGVGGLSALVVLALKNGQPWHGLLWALAVAAPLAGLLHWLEPWIALTLSPFLAAVALSPFLMRRRVDELGSAAREAAGELGAFAVDSVQGLGEIVAFQAEGARGAELDRLSERHIGLRRPFHAALTAQSALLETFTGLGGLAVVVVGAALSTHGAIDAGLLPLLTLLAMAAFLP